MSTDHIRVTDITNRTSHGRNAASLAYSALNNAGQGFDPSDLSDSGAAELVRRAENTSDVSVYRYTDDDGDEWLLLVGADGMGSDDSRWAVRVGDAGIDISAGY